MKNLFLILFLVPLLICTDICDPKLGVNELPINENSKLTSGIIEFKPSMNSSTIIDCVQSCCSDLKCNFAFLKESNTCYLITCSDNELNSCVPEKNLNKPPNDPVDILVQVRAVGTLPRENKLIENLIRKEKEDLSAFLAHESEVSQCSPQENTCGVNEQCLFNNIKKIYECVCPRGLVIVQGVCREMFSETPGCELYIDRCGQNEECVAKNEFNKHGTCQCRLGYRRNLDNLRCELERVEGAKSMRRRPIVKQEEESEEDDESFWQRFFEEIGIRKKRPNQNRTTPAPTTSKLTDPPKIFTQNLQANAGQDINVFYPSRVCTLNGSLTSFYQKISKWEWIKDPSSPAFGRFLDTNEAAIVQYENMIEGEYKFILKVWTQDGEFSQDFVHVYVHGPVNEKLSQFVNSSELNENIIEIELDLEPSLLSETLKVEFLNKLQIFLRDNKEFKLIDPKLVLVNTRLSINSYKSTVVLEIVVTDLLNVTNQDLGDKNRKVCSSGPLVHQLRRKQKSFKNVLDSIETIIKRIQTDGINNKTFLNQIQKEFGTKKKSRKSVLDFMNVKIMSIRQMTCFDDRLFDNNEVRYNCSSHGHCDMHSRKCICNRYWMFNFYRYYFHYESDLTNGNNCEYNIPLTILIVTLISIIVYLSLKIVFKYFLYYLCCCCLCCRRMKVDLKSSPLIKGRRDESYLNEASDGDDYDELKKYKKKSKGFLDRLRNVPSSSSKRSQHKYALLQTEENESLNGSISEDRFFKKNGIDQKLGAQLDMNDDEDVVYEDTMINNAKQRSNPQQNLVKKYNLI